MNAAINNPNPQNPGVCAECGLSFPPDDMVQLFGASVCARCKPIFLQKLQEGAPVGSSGQVWRDGKTLVLPFGSVPPARCARCNGPVTQAPIKRTLYWHQPWIYILILVSLLIYIIVAIIVRKKAVVFVPLCDHDRKQRTGYIAASWGLVVLSLGSFWWAIAGSKGELALAGIAFLIAGAVLGVAKGTLVTAKKIENSFVWVRGFCPSYLEQLPEWRNLS